MNDTTASTAIEALRAALAEKPDGVLESLAVTHGVPLRRVLDCLPEGMCTWIAGEYFIEVLRDIGGWGDINFVVHTKDCVVEVEGPMPGGTPAHGFYNLKAGHALHGHLRHGNCVAIAFVRRPFMGMATLSVQFYNADGEAMFKIFVGRDKSRQLKADQVERFAQLEARYATASAAA